MIARVLFVVVLIVAESSAEPRIRDLGSLNGTLLAGQRIDESPLADGDEFAVGVFTYRALAGAIFALIFYFRSLSHAVYTHFLYDFYVLVVRG